MSRRVDPELWACLSLIAMLAVAFALALTGAITPLHMSDAVCTTDTDCGCTDDCLD